MDPVNAERLRDELIQAHQALDWLLASYLLAHREAMPSNISVWELGHWDPPEGRTAQTARAACMLGWLHGGWIQLHPEREAHTAGVLELAKWALDRQAELVNTGEISKNGATGNQ